MAENSKTQADDRKVAEAQAAQSAQAQTVVAKTQADLALEKEQAINRARLERDDAARAKGKKFTMICVSPFTLVDDEFPEGRVVTAGEELEVAARDVHAYTGRCRLKADDGDPDRVLGPQVTRG